MYTLNIETERLILREFQLSDTPFFFELNSNPLVVKYTGDGAFANLTEAEKITQYVINQYNENGFGRWLVIEKETSFPIGWCGLKFHKEEQEVDLGYRFLQSHWGKGYATEAAKRCVNYGFNELKLDRIIANAIVENSASINVFKKLGMTFLKDSLCDELPSVTYELKKENYN